MENIIGTIIQQQHITGHYLYYVLSGLLLYGVFTNFIFPYIRSQAMAQKELDKNIIFLKKEKILNKCHEEFIDNNWSISIYLLNVFCGIRCTEPQKADLLMSLHREFKPQELKVLDLFSTYSNNQLKCDWLKVAILFFLVFMGYLIILSHHSVNPIDWLLWFALDSLFSAFVMAVVIKFTKFLSLLRKYKRRYTMAQNEYPEK